MRVRASVLYAHAIDGLHPADARVCVQRGVRAPEPVVAVGLRHRVCPRDVARPAAVQLISAGRFPPTPERRSGVVGHYVRPAQLSVALAATERARRTAVDAVMAAARRVSGVIQRGITRPRPVTIGDDTGDAAWDAPEDAAGDAPKDAARDAPKDAAGDAPKDAREDTITEHVPDTGADVRLPLAVARRLHEDQLQVVAAAVGRSVAARRRRLVESRWQVRLDEVPEVVQVIHQRPRAVVRWGGRRGQPPLLAARPPLPPVLVLRLRRALLRRDAQPLRSVVVEVVLHVVVAFVAAVQPHVRQTTPHRPAALGGAPDVTRLPPVPWPLRDALRPGSGRVPHPAMLTLAERRGGSVGEVAREDGPTAHFADGRRRLVHRLSFWRRQVL